MLLTNIIHALAHMYTVRLLRQLAEWADPTFTEAWKFWLVAKTVANAPKDAEGNRKGHFRIVEGRNRSWYLQWTDLQIKREGIASFNVG